MACARSREWVQYALCTWRGVEVRKDGCATLVSERRQNWPGPIGFNSPVQWGSEILASFSLADFNSEWTDHLLASSSSSLNLLILSTRPGPVIYRTVPNGALPFPANISCTDTIQCTRTVPACQSRQVSTCDTCQNQGSLYPSVSRRSCSLYSTPVLHKTYPVLLLVIMK